MIYVSYNLPVYAFRLVESEEFVPRPCYDQRGIGVRVVLGQVAVGHFQTVALAAPHFEFAVGHFVIPRTSPTSHVHGLVTVGCVTLFGFSAVVSPEAIADSVDEDVASGEEDVIFAFVSDLGEFVYGV